MARKSWSNLLLLMAAIDLSFAVASHHPFRLAGLIVLPMLIVLATYLRQRMI